MICATCNLTLPPGAHHPDPKACIEALRARLDACDKCGGRVGCFRCSAKDAAANAAKNVARNKLGAIGELIWPSRPDETTGGRSA